jgi:DNA-binding response OmpR family regulator
MPAAKIHLTPMQKQLMDLFAAAPNHTLSKEEICAALWPKKDDPDDTLYTFISRLKSSLKRQSTCRIINERGEAYTLVSQDEMA